MKGVLIHDQLPSVHMREHVQTLMCARTVAPLVPRWRRLEYKQVKMVGILRGVIVHRKQSSHFLVQMEKCAPMKGMYYIRLH